MVNEILHQSRTTPFVGDDANLLLTFLVFLSCKTDNPLNLEMIGAAQAEDIHDCVTQGTRTPKSMVMVFTGASKEALKYDYDEVSEEGRFIVNVGGKCIVILEKDESFSFIRRMKPLMSGDDDELVWKTPIKNELAVEIETRDFIIRGRPSFITLTTRNPSEAKRITRQLLHDSGHNTDKVEAVVSNSLLAKARPELLKIHEDLELLQASMLELKEYRVRNIFAPLMADFFPSRNAQHQRDIGKVLSIIDAITLIHQNQEVQTSDDGEQFLLASIEDNVLVWFCVIWFSNEAFRVLTILGRCSCKWKRWRMRLAHWRRITFSNGFTFMLSPVQECFEREASSDSWRCWIDWSQASWWRTWWWS